MATRFYFTNTPMTDVAPRFNGPEGSPSLWTKNIDNAERYLLSTEKQGDAFVVPSIVADDGWGYYLLRQYVSPPLTARLLETCELFGYIRAMVDEATVNSSVVVRLVSNDGLEYRKDTIDYSYILAAREVGPTAFPAGVLTNRRLFSNDWMYGDFNIQDGDRLVVEIGFTGGSASTPEVSYEFGDDSESDLAFNEVGTDQYAPWIEFDEEIEVLGGEEEEIFLSGEFAHEGSLNLAAAIESWGTISLSGEFIWESIDFPMTAGDEPQAAIISLSGQFTYASLNVMSAGVLATATIPWNAAFTYEGALTLTTASLLEAATISLQGEFRHEGALTLTTPLEETLFPDLDNLISLAGEMVWDGSLLTTVTLTPAAIRMEGWFTWEAGISLTAEEPVPGVAEVIRLAGDFVWEGRNVITALEQAAEIYLHGDFYWEWTTGMQEIVAETWVLTGHGRHPSLYSGFDFNSFIVFQGQVYGVKADGIYELAGGTDNGQAIRTGLRLTTNFGTPRLKRLRQVDPGDCGTSARLKVKGSRKGTTRTFSLERGRFAVSRDIEDVEMVLDFLDFDQLGHIKFQVLELVK
jgi:hypothetical protein